MPISLTSSSSDLGSSVVMTAEHEVAQLNYIQDSDLFLRQKPYEVLSEAPLGLAKCNFRVKPGPPETIHDLRGQETKFDLDSHGFKIVSSPLRTTVFNDETINNQYLPEVEMLLRSIEPSAQVHFFDWQLRSSDLPNPKPGAKIDLNDSMLRLKPVHAVHVGESNISQNDGITKPLRLRTDQSPYAAMKRAGAILGSDPSVYRNKRIRIVNVWRPIWHAVENYPLAVCDGSSVPPEKLLKVDHVRKYHVGESLYPLPSTAYKWYYLRGQTPDETLVFKMFDSKEDVPAKCCPHTSFAKSQVSDSAKPRESIEVRVLMVSEM